MTAAMSLGSGSKIVVSGNAGTQVAVAGSVQSAAIYELKAENAVGELIQMAGGLTAVAAVMTTAGRSVRAEPISSAPGANVES